MSTKILTTIIIAIFILNLSCSQQNIVDSNPNIIDESEIRKPDIEILSNVQSHYSSLVNKVIPSIVSIRVIADDYRMFFGTGVIIDDSGLILTSEHVISQAGEINVVLHNRDLFYAKIIGKDFFTDLAIIKIDNANKLKPIEFAEKNDVKVGNIVFSFGNAFGISFNDGQPSVISGIVSALERVAIPNGNNRMYWGAIQHDCAVNPGNSGGPLCNIQGKMIGLNGVISTNTGNSSGVSFAIPMESVKKYLPALKKGKKIIHPYLGFSSLDNIINQEENKISIRGVRINTILPDSPASKSEIKPGDIILSADDQKINDKAELLNWLSKKNYGEKVIFKILRVDKKTLLGTVSKVEITIGIRPD